MSKNNVKIEPLSERISTVREFRKHFRLCIKFASKNTVKKNELNKRGFKKLPHIRNVCKQEIAFTESNIIEKVK